MTVVDIDEFWCLISIYPNGHSETYAFSIQCPCGFSEADALRNCRGNIGPSFTSSSIFPCPGQGDWVRDRHLT